MRFLTKKNPPTPRVMKAIGMTRTSARTDVGRFFRHNHPEKFEELYQKWYAIMMKREEGA
jgi:hypothetical protein